MNNSNKDQSFAREKDKKERFEFGANWANFLKSLNDRKIERAMKSLQSMLGLETLEGRSFLDIGSGSGLFSLAARMLGARVHSFDYDRQSVLCTRELKRRYYPVDEEWIIEQGSVLDRQYLSRLGTFNIVYSWGVLHHTGNMRQALDDAAGLVETNGLLFLAIYNNQGWPSRFWTFIKKTYNRLPPGFRWIILIPCFIRLRGPMILKGFLRGNPLGFWRNYSAERGMSPWHDVVDWVGGWPFEVAKPEEIFEFYFSRGFHLVKMKTCAGGKGCNEFVFRKSGHSRNSI